MAEQADNRLTPFETTIPLSVHCTVTFDVPDGFRAEQPIALKPQFDSRFAASNGQVRLVGHKLQLEFQWRLPTGKHKASEYAAYRDSMVLALSQLEREVVFKSAGY